MGMLHRKSDLRCTATTILVITLGACGPVEGPEVGTIARGVGTYSEVTGFGSNPGGLKAFKYVPNPAPSGPAPLVLALHACSQSASVYQSAGWNALADQHGFYVLYPEQQTGNNGLRCFNWAGEYGDPTNLMRGEGENQSIIQMIDKMKADHAIDARRVFIMGHSGGAAQTALMLATWPEVFAAGGMIAGIPYNCTTTFTEVTTCLNPGINRTPQQWGDRARAGHSGYAGPWPRLSVWQGTADSTVNPANARETLEQWTNVHGIDQQEDATGTVDGATHKEFKDGQGRTLVELYEIPAMNHGTPVVPGMGCGTIGAYFLDAGICAVEHLGDFFGITGGAAGDTTPPAVNVSAPSAGSAVSGVVQVRVDATDDVGVSRVELFIDGGLAATLRAAPYQHAWNTALAANGEHHLRAVAYDAAGNQAEDDDTTVTVSGGVTDRQPPTVNLTSPADGETVSGAVSLSATAMDDLGVARVEFKVDGNGVGVATSPPYAVTWDASAAAAGAHHLSVTAFDAAGNQATDDDTTVQVTAPPMDTTPPTARILEPADGSTVKGVVTVKLEASDAGGLKTALLFLGDELIGSDYRAPFEFLWDTGGYPTGGHMLAARVFDVAGNFTVASAQVVVERGEGTSDDETERVFYGRKHWGCSASPWPEDQLVLGLLVLFALGALRRRPR